MHAILVQYDTYLKTRECPVVYHPDFARASYYYTSSASTLLYSELLYHKKRNVQKSHRNSTMRRSVSTKHTNGEWIL